MASGSPGLASPVSAPVGSLTLLLCRSGCSARPPPSFSSLGGNCELLLEERRRASFPPTFAQVLQGTPLPGRAALLVFPLPWRRRRWSRPFPTDQGRALPQGPARRGEAVGNGTGLGRRLGGRRGEAPPEALHRGASLITLGPARLLPGGAPAVPALDEAPVPPGRGELAFGLGQREAARLSSGKHKKKPLSNLWDSRRGSAKAGTASPAAARHAYLGQTAVSLIKASSLEDKCFFLDEEQTALRNLPT